LKFLIALCEFKYMNLLFLVALALAWPTAGLSLVAWFALFVLAKIRQKRGPANIKEKKELLEKIVDGRYIEFFNSLDFPKKPDHLINDDHARTMARLIINHISKHDDEMKLFIDGVSRWVNKDSQEVDVVKMIELEKDDENRGGIHYASYRALLSLIRNNKLEIFNGIHVTNLAVEDAINISRAANNRV